MAKSRSKSSGGASRKSDNTGMWLVGAGAAGIAAYMLWPRNANAAMPPTRLPDGTGGGSTSTGGGGGGSTRTGGGSSTTSASMTPPNGYPTSRLQQDLRVIAIGSDWDWANAINPVSDGRFGPVTRAAFNAFQNAIAAQDINLVPAVQEAGQWLAVARAQAIFHGRRGSQDMPLPNPLPTNPGDPIFIRLSKQLRTMGFRDMAAFLARYPQANASGVAILSDTRDQNERIQLVTAVNGRYRTYAGV